MRVVPVPCLKDNYAYLVIDGDRAAVVDPGEAPPIEAALKRENVTLAAVWATHHHYDHTDGIPALVAAHPGIEVVIGTVDAENVKYRPQITRRVNDGDVIELGNVRAKVIHNPGHTLGAVSFHVADPGWVFTGDTLFAAGCGRVFEGDPAMMRASLGKLAELPPETKVYFGHEYTASNLKFALAVEPDSGPITKRAHAVAEQRARDELTTPSTIGEERATNPFLRTTEPRVYAAAQNRDDSVSDPDTAFAAIRTWKNNFK